MIDLWIIKEVIGGFVIYEGKSYKKIYEVVNIIVVCGIIDI